MKPAGETCGRIRAASAFVLSAIVAGVFAFVAGVAGGVIGIYLYDRGTSKGNDVAVGMIGALAAGTFVFVTVFAWESNKHHKISWRTPAFALVPCLALAAVPTWLKRGDPDYPYYSDFVFAGWIVILVCGLLALYVCRLFVTREPVRFNL
jgi:uncharacterized membrane protein YfcA